MALTLLLDCAISKDRIVDTNSSQIVVLLVIRLDECIRDVWDVIATIALACEVHFAVVNFECVDEVFVEADELLAQFYFVRDVRLALRETYADRLFNPEHIGEVDPTRELELSEIAL